MHLSSSFGHNISLNSIAILSPVLRREMAIRLHRRILAVLKSRSVNKSRSVLFQVLTDEMTTAVIVGNDAG
jgi:hypothetical protein